MAHCIIHHEKRRRPHHPERRQNFRALAQNGQLYVRHVLRRLERGFNSLRRLFPGFAEGLGREFHKPVVIHIDRLRDVGFPLVRFVQIDRPLQNAPCRGSGASHCYRANVEQRVAAFLFKGPSSTARFFWLVTIYFNVKPAFFELNCLNYTKMHTERIRQLLKQQRLLVRIVTLMFVFRQPL